MQPSVRPVQIGYPIHCRNSLLAIRKCLKKLCLGLLMWCLGHCQQILIGDLIPEEHTNWKNFLLLLDIVNELFAAVTHPHRADYLSIIVGEFLEDFKELYPNKPLTPKMHMPTWTKRYVPLKHSRKLLENLKLIVSDVVHLYDSGVCDTRQSTATSNS